ncbi:MAG: MFS transporter [Verrucomicrobiota bacterium]
MTTQSTRPEDRIPTGQKAAYAVGMLVNNLQAAALPAMMVILILGLGMDPLLVGVIGLWPRVFDALSDPMVGYWSDHTRTRWGRRRPFILVGALLAGILFAAMWQMPEGSSQRFYFWFFLVLSVLYILTYTLYATPFVALGYEMTPDYHERTRLHAVANTVGQLAWIGVPWFYALMENDRLFDNAAHGARVLAIWVGGTIAVFGLFPALFCRERSEFLKAKVATAGGFKRNFVDFFRGLAMTVKCPPFLCLCGATFLVFNGFQLGTSFSLFVMIFYVYGGAEGANDAAGSLNGTFGSLTAICSLLVIPLAAWIAGRIGKRNTFFLTISLSIIGYALKWFGYNPEYPYLLLIAAPFVSFGIGSLFTLMGSMISDVCDYDELRSHERREGTFGAIYWWMVKVGMALAGLMTGVLLKYADFDSAEGALQEESTLFYLRLFDVLIPICTSALAILIMYGYTLSETRAREIRDELEARRGKLPA